MGLIGLISGLKELDLGQSGLKVGDVRTDIRKFTPVSYRTSALWGRCPKEGHYCIWAGAVSSKCSKTPKK